MLPWIRQFRSGFRRKAISARPVRINERIRIREVRLIDEDGAQLGVVATRDALETARERGLDLVEVQPNASPPVCRLMDYGRFRYEESRRERDSRKKAKGATLKEVRLAPKIGAHDLQTKARQAQKFLEEGDKVKVSVLFRGREMLHQEIGRGLLDQVIVQLQPFGNLEQDARMEGRSMSIFMSPKPAARPAAPAAADVSSTDDSDDVAPVETPSVVANTAAPLEVPSTADAVAPVAVAPVAADKAEPVETPTVVVDASAAAETATLSPAVEEFAAVATDSGAGEPVPVSAPEAATKTRSARKPAAAPAATADVEPEA